MKTKIQKPIKILGELIDPDNQPILYWKAITNELELERQLKSLVNVWGGSVRAAILSLESDLQHG
ncbi:hypothetical protein A3E17_00750 [Candidatus Amesbacteria bacterium RIFCSPHIGHO2_12_FULL_48_14]|uniref:Uncharacterized protein n=2 Tax=Microgenomates group TaxID=1794810 RepID=A0A1F4Z488_9BACT|nr:MAG: hypothetical protein A3E17_00750 [Candidatus Amesbacteria bacterium RIFCSPHIGHO2_12_FULL_48_14]OGY30319.1 MAG: hypothetical protein A3J50_00480 [Candidatus Woykebacteria bacterium RIFCSPHIGHO2_02_FULL_43_16b]